MKGCSLSAHEHPVDRHHVGLYSHVRARMTSGVLQLNPDWRRPLLRPMPLEEPMYHVLDYLSCDSKAT